MVFLCPECCTLHLKAFPGKKGGMVPAKETWDHQHRAAQGPHRAAFEGHPHPRAHARLSLQRPKRRGTDTASHECTPVEKQPTRPSPWPGTYFSDARGKDATVTITGKQLSGRLGRKCLAQQLQELQP